MPTLNVPASGLAGMSSARAAADSAVNPSASINALATRNVVLECSMVTPCSDEATLLIATLRPRLRQPVFPRCRRTDNPSIDVRLPWHQGEIAAQPHASAT